MNKLNSALLGALLLTAPLLILNPLRGTAHEVKVSGDIGGTLHIEPNDNPIAGTSSLAWFALNRRGGQPVRLSDCNCSLAVYAQPRRPGDSPIQQPSLTAKAVEGRSGVPSANLTFPRAGAYDLVLKGQPVTSGDFSAFELRFSVTVAQ
ncbi:MAG: hypothetical protein KME15_08460 [Drouetiella hepatica Uher 2000/2452]|uniref:Uncharacterized protein n=1 Tax=Drouetiella hepatica Uher 2000/2452 TaxID=904376 RepID=A0A951Q8I9_9CYAN|nr:hypothetical protein [Drouetiella hepatica Uher 2000/2452]